MKDTQESMLIQLKETNKMLHAINRRQEENNAKLDSLSFNVKYMMDDIKEIKEDKRKDIMRRA